MSNPYVGEIRMFGGSFAPSGWAFCSGSLMPISENETLFNLIGTTYGGDGQETFALPDLQGRLPMHMGTGSGLSTHTIGEISGVETVTLTTSQIPSHNHALVAGSSGAGQISPLGNLPNTSLVAMYIDFQSLSANMNANAVASAGGSQPHDNMMPYTVVSFIISLYGIFPSQT